MRAQLTTLAVTIFLVCAHSATAASLHDSAEHGDSEEIAHLIDRGADVDQRERHTEKVALHYAARGGHLDVVRLLLDKGANVEPGDKYGVTPLMEAAKEGHRDVVAFLIERGADVNNATDDARRTALWEATCEGHVDIVELLLNRGTDVNATDSSGRTPLYCAIIYRRLDMVQFLLRNGADPNARKNDGKTPLIYVLGEAKSNPETCLPIAHLLIQMGADVTVRDTRGTTALHVAAGWGFRRETELLIESGADIHGRDDDGSTPLHDAASLGRFDTAQLLIDEGADIHARSKLGFTPLHCAAQGGEAKLVRLLLKLGADVNAASRDGRTPLNFALQWNHKEVVDLLHEYEGKKASSCTNASDIEKINRGTIRRLFHLQGADAKVFLALDPRLLAYPDALELLMEQDIDEIVVWRLKSRGRLGTAVPFSEGCAVDGYGEPDELDKIQLMGDIVIEINRFGLDDERVKRKMRKLWEYQPQLPPEELEDQVDTVRARVALLLQSE